VEPGFLVAAPQMRDEVFARTVVLLIHHDADGALGLVVNRPGPVRLVDVVPDAPMDADPGTAWGGPVEPSMGFVVYRGEAPEGWQVGPEVAVSGSRDRLERLTRGTDPFFLCLGYAGWGPGQLDAEYADGSWIHVDLDPAILFEAPPEERYVRALARLGLSAERVWMIPGDA
jgi:putative transcriptional regulator